MQGTPGGNRSADIDVTNMSEELQIRQPVLARCRRAVNRIKGAWCDMANL